MDSKKIEYKNISQLFLDDRNPRLPSYLQGANEDKIIEFMLLEAATIELMQAIGENGFYPGEMLLVVEEESKYRVVEGNRRLTSVKLLNDPSLAKVQTKRVRQVAEEAQGLPIHQLPCLIFEQEKEILKYLGYRHITGVQPWNLRQKARYLYSLKESVYPDLPLDDACRKLAKMIGSRRDYVKRLLVGFMVYSEIEDNAFYKIKDLEEDTFYFGYISDSLSRANIVDFLEIDLNKEDPLESLDRRNLETWTKWFFEKNPENQTRLKGKSQDLNMLNKILSDSNASALAAFKDGMSLNKAYQLTEDIDALFSDAVAEALSNLEHADSISHKVKRFAANLNDDLREINKLIKKIKSAKDEFENAEFEDDI